MAARLKRCHLIAHCGEATFDGAEAECLRRAMLLLLATFPFASYLENVCSAPANCHELSDLRERPVAGALAEAGAGRLARYILLHSALDAWLVHELMLRVRLLCHRMGHEGEDPLPYAYAQ